ncbi:MAG: hypothetical protein AABW83_03740 [Nanoarchaeota archaeon]
MVEIIKEKREIDGIISEKIKNKKLIFTTHYRISSSEKGIDDEQVKEIFLQFEKIYAIEKEILKYGDIGYELFYRLKDNTDFSIATCPKEDKLIMSEMLKTSPFMVRSFRSILKNSHLKEKSPIKSPPLGRGGDFSGIFFDNSCGKIQEKHW